MNENTKEFNLKEFAEEKRIKYLDLVQKHFKLEHSLSQKKAFRLFKASFSSKQRKQDLEPEYMISKVDGRKAEFRKIGNYYIHLYCNCYYVAKKEQFKDGFVESFVTVIPFEGDYTLPKSIYEIEYYVYNDFSYIKSNLNHIFPRLSYYPNGTLMDAPPAIDDKQIFSPSRAVINLRNDEIKIDDQINNLTREYEDKLAKLNQKKSQLETDRLSILSYIGSPDSNGLVVKGTKDIISLVDQHIQEFKAAEKVLGNQI